MGFFDHPSFSLDSAPSYFACFQTRSSLLLAFQWFAKDKELKNAVTDSLHSQVTDFYTEGISMTVQEYNCLNLFGDYVEK